jgi:hypothetical protein
MLARCLAYATLAIAVSCSAPESRVRDDPIVNKALDIYGKGKISRAHLRAEYDINIVYLPKMTCVGLNLRPGTVGGDTTMCFDKSGRFLGYYIDGD